MLLISGEIIKEVYTMKEAVEATKKAFQLFSEGSTDVPLRTHLAIQKHNGRVLFMPAYVKDPLDAVGIKIVSVYFDNPSKGLPAIPSVVTLMDATTGMPKAILNGTVLTQIRTGAASGAATDLLARKDAQIGAIFGAGGQAPSQIEAMITVRPLKEVRIFDPIRERATNLIEKIKANTPFNKVKLTATNTPEETVNGADIITTVTTARGPVFNAKDIKKGAHINAVGSYTPDMQELDPLIFGKCGKLFLDSRKAVLEESGDLIKPLKEGLLLEDQISGELGELVAGKKVGRESEDEITIFKTVGLAVQDVVVAEDIYKKVTHAGVGLSVDL